VEENLLQKSPGTYSAHWNVESATEIIPVTDAANAGLCPVNIAMCFQTKRLTIARTTSGPGKY
jgi:hypothetical protein